MKRQSMSRLKFLAFSVLVITISLAAVITAQEGWNAPEGALISVNVDTAPNLDGMADDDVWKNAPETTIGVSGGANNGATEVAMKSVYADDQVYVLLTWADPTKSFLRAPWEKQADGSWSVLKDPDDKGSDNNLYYEDKLSLIWSIDASLANFKAGGCFTLCHAGENGDVKPYGNKYTAEAGQKGDIWHWKSVRNLNQLDDQYLDHTRYSKETPGAGRKGDPKESGGYVKNQTEDKKLPAFMLPVGQPTDGSPGYILDSEKVPFDDTQFKAGDRIPGIIKAQFVGDRGDIAASWTWDSGVWTLELSRKLVTGSEFDVQFQDLDATYSFGVATFDNAQVRHAFAVMSTPFVFKP